MSLEAFFQAHSKIAVITGAGISAASGIPAYRNDRGEWQHAQPMEYRDFVSSDYSRQRYWARSALGRPRFKSVKPNAAHRAITRLEKIGKISTLITQNVDGLHQCAGSCNVINLHGSLDQVICLQCGHRSGRDEHQSLLIKHNPLLKELSATPLPDGDVLLENFDFSTVTVPQCQQCQGIIKPDVVFYGENVPRERVQACYDAIDLSDAMLVVGSSLMVYSGFRFVRHAHEQGKAIAAVNLGVTRADDLFDLKIEADCSIALASLVE